MKADFLSIAPLQERLETLSSSQRVLLVVATILILGAGFYFLKYKPDAQRLTNLHHRISQQQRRLVQLKQAASQIGKFKKENAEAELQLRDLLTLLPDEKEIPGLLDSISQLGAQVGLENVLFQPQPEKTHEFYAAIPVRLDMVGSFNELGLFFDKISKLDRILKVENLQISRQKAPASLRVGCTVVTYRFLEHAKPKNGAKKKR